MLRIKIGPKEHKKGSPTATYGVGKEAYCGHLEACKRESWLAKPGPLATGPYEPRGPDHQGGRTQLKTFCIQTVVSGFLP
ncbi:hypothetical protein NECAME_04963 [Necator americanus]|uniref:Uncharacterized protein n=1 Tax=Necator americanus TaxID=51031 RepID=W2SNK9_NECAM|nr:hypothetical protein NECAME_04963 [Necator americanus]ETN70272.1 hypothetical protein NECAME_04963 [Necator americanus]